MHHSPSPASTCATTSCERGRLNRADDVRPARRAQMKVEDGRGRAADLIPPPPTVRPRHALAPVAPCAPALDPHARARPARADARPARRAQMKVEVEPPIPQPPPKVRCSTPSPLSPPTPLLSTHTQKCPPLAPRSRPPARADARPARSARRWRSSRRSRRRCPRCAAPRPRPCHLGHRAPPREQVARLYLPPAAPCLPPSALYLPPTAPYLRPSAPYLPLVPYLPPTAP